MCMGNTSTRCRSKKAVAVWWVDKSLLQVARVGLSDAHPLFMDDTVDFQCVPFVFLWPVAEGRVGETGRLWREPEKHMSG